MKLTRYDLMLWLVVLVMFVSSWQPAHAVTRVTSATLFMPAAYAGDYYEVTCPQAGAELCAAGGSGITPVKRRITLAAEMP